MRAPRPMDVLLQRQSVGDGERCSAARLRNGNVLNSSVLRCLLESRRKSEVTHVHSSSVTIHIMSRMGSVQGCSVLVFRRRRSHLKDILKQAGVTSPVFRPDRPRPFPINRHIASRYSARGEHTRDIEVTLRCDAFIYASSSRYTSYPSWRTTHPMRSSCDHTPCSAGQPRPQSGQNEPA